MPDYFVAEDTLGVTSYYIQAINQGWVSKFAYIYVDSNREILNGHQNWEETVKNLKKADLPHKFALYAAQNGVKQRNNLLKKSYALLQNTLISLILEDFYDTETRIKFSNLTDPNVKEAQRLFAENKHMPQAPEKQ